MDSRRRAWHRVSRLWLLVYQTLTSDRAYTVAAIANWAVTWTSNGQSGVINVPAAAGYHRCQSESFRCSFDHFDPAARCFPSRPRHPPRAS